MTANTNSSRRRRSRRIQFPAERVASVTEFLDAVKRATSDWITEGNFRPWLLEIPQCHRR